MKRPVVAILLSVFVLPGLGHLYWGKRNKGIALLMAVNLLLLMSLFFALKLSSPLIGAHLTGTPLTPALIMEKIQPYAFWAKLLLAAFLGLWGFGIMDLFKVLREPAGEADN